MIALNIKPDRIQKILSVLIEMINYRGTGTFLLYLKCSARDTYPYQASEKVYSKEDRKKGMFS